MVIADHINLQPENPLAGRNNEELGPRFPDMSEPYKRTLIGKALEIAKQNKITCHTGVYVAVPGPNLETKAEYRYLRIIGGDAVGMSTVPEVIVANHMGLPVFAISVLTDEGFTDVLLPVSLEEIIETAAKAESDGSKVKRKGGKAFTVVPAKYRGPDGETWSGRGLTPRWLAALMQPFQ